MSTVIKINVAVTREQTWWEPNQMFFSYLKVQTWKPNIESSADNPNLLEILHVVRTIPYVTSVGEK